MNLFLFILIIISSIIFAVNFFLLRETVKLHGNIISILDIFKLSTLFIFFTLVPFVNIILSILFLYILYNTYKITNKEIADKIMQKLTKAN